MADRIFDTQVRSLRGRLCLRVLVLSCLLGLASTGTSHAVCGDTNDSTVVEAGDALAIREVLADLSPALAAPDNCNVIGAADAADLDGNGLPDDCDLVDLVVLLRSLVNAAPGIAHVCQGEPPLGPVAVPNDGVGSQEPAFDDTNASAVNLDEAGTVLNTGEHQLIRDDFEIPGRGRIDFMFTRTYRSGWTYDGPLGHSWDFSYNEGLHVQPGGDVLRQNGRGHVDVWVQQMDGSYQAPLGFFATLTQEPDGRFVYREPDGFTRFYDVNGRLRSHQDRFGNRLRFEYDPSGNLNQAIDPYGRVIDFVFQNQAGVDRLVQIVDFDGRVVSYSYDVSGDLTEVTSPSVTGTSTGNDFPVGRSEQYTYSSGFGDAKLNHNMLTLTRPEEVDQAGPPSVVCTYYTNPGDPVSFDRVSSKTLGGTNASGIPAGGTLNYTYQALNEAVPLGDPSLPRLQVNVTQRNGNIVHFFGNERKHEIWRRELTRGLRPGEPAFYETRFEYDADGLRTRHLMPEGNETVYTYDAAGPRAAQPNLLETRRIADVARGGGGDLVTTMTYEPVFNQLATRTDPRGNAVAFIPPIGGASAARYTTNHLYDYQEGNAPIPDVVKYGIDISGVSRNLGDLNSDGATDQIIGRRVRTEEPPVLLVAGSNEAIRIGSTSQTILREMQWNDRGQLTAGIDPEGNLTTYDYHPENDPDGDGSPVPGETSTAARGYLESQTQDALPAPARRTASAAPAELQTVLGYDAVGNVTSRRDPRGVVNAYEVNALNEVVVDTRGADVSEAAATGELITGEAAFGYRQRSHYDFNGRVVLVENENRAGVSTTAGVGDFVEWTSVYDILDNLLEASIEIDASTQAVSQNRYDANELQTQRIKPEGNIVQVDYDERNLMFRVHDGFGSPEVAVVQYDYDLNGNLARRVDAEDNDSDGNPEESTFVRDGFDRGITRTFPLGLETLYSYDVASNVVQITTMGHRAGQPLAGSVLLADQFFSYDELNRIYRTDDALFLADGFFPLRFEDLLDFDSDGNVTTLTEYDALSRATFFVEDDIDTTQVIFDGASRKLETIDALGNRLVRVYDQNSNLVEEQSVEISPAGLVPDETFTNRYVYDQLDRLVRSTDNVGRTSRFDYDSRDNPTTSSDGVGATIGTDPLGLFPGAINDVGNTQTNHYDGRNLAVREVSDLRVGGSGSGAIDTSNASNPDGQIEVQYVYDLSSRLTGLVDDNGNTTSYAYDALDRRLSQTNADATQFDYGYDRDSNATTVTDPNGSVIVNTFDALNRLVGRSVTRGAGVLGTTAETYAYDGLSRQTASFDNNGTGGNHRTESFYDSLNRLLEEHEDGDPHSSVYTGDGNRILLVYPTTRVLGYEYDALDRIVNVGNPVPPAPLTAETSSDSPASSKRSQTRTKPVPGSPSTSRSTSSATASSGDGATSPLVAAGSPPVEGTVVAYDWIGGGSCHVDCPCDCRALLMGFGNGTELSFLDNAGTSDVGYDGAADVIALRHLDGPTVLIDRSYTYDRAYMRTSEQLFDVGGSPTNTFGRDSAYRVTDTDLPADSAPEAFGTLLEYTLDGAGNRIAVDVTQDFGGGATFQFTENYVPNLMNEYDDVGGGGRTHDANGNLTGANALDYSYDYKNRLVEVRRQVDQVVLARYEYDTANRRVQKFVFDLGNPGTVVEDRRYRHDGWNVIEEWGDQTDFDDNGPLSTYVYGGGFNRPLQLETSISFPAGAGTFFYHRDARNNIVAMTDSAGVIVEKTRYQDFGNFEQSVSIGNPLLFQSQPYDPETGLFYFRNRYYDPLTGRFLQRDPVWDAGNAANQYTFVANNPVSLEDPYGLHGRHSQEEGDCPPPVGGKECPCWRQAIDWEGGGYPGKNNRWINGAPPHRPSDAGALKWPKTGTKTKKPKPTTTPKPAKKPKPKPPPKPKTPAEIKAEKKAEQIKAAKHAAWLKNIKFKQKHGGMSEKDWEKAKKEAMGEEEKNKEIKGLGWLDNPSVGFDDVDDVDSIPPPDKPSKSKSKKKRGKKKKRR